MSDNPYPNLGFNPVPGVPDNVESMKTTLDGATHALSETNSQLSRLRDGTDGVWKGQAGDAFRAHFDNTLGTDLKLAQDSLDKAVHLLNDWHGNLVGFKSTAGGLEQEMAAATNSHTQAEASLTRAKANPDLQLVGQTFSAQDLPAAQQRINTAEAAVTSATTAVNDARGTIDSILKRAHDLEHDCESTAKRFADELKDAAKKLAPHEPGFWDRMFSSFENALKGIGDWITKHQKAIHDTLSTISAVTGFLALVTPPPADAAFAAVAAVAGLGALASDAFNPEVRKAVTDVFNDVKDGQWPSTKDLGALSTVGLDAMGSLPGIGPLAKAGNALRGADGLADATKIMSAAAKDPGLMVRGLDKVIPNSALKSVGLIGAHTADDFRLDTLARLWRGKAVVTDTVTDVKDWFTS